MSRQAFIADAWQVVGRKVSKERLLSDIYTTAVGSVGLPVHPDSDAVRMFRLVLAEGRSLVRQRDEIEARAVERRASVRSALLSVADDHSRNRPDQRHDDSCRGWRSAPLPASPPVPEIRRPRKTNALEAKLRHSPASTTIDRMSTSPRLGQDHDFYARVRLGFRPFDSNMIPEWISHQTQSTSKSRQCIGFIVKIFCRARSESATFRL